MLIEFRVSNWKSFRDEIVLSMEALTERRFSERLSRLGKGGKDRKILKRQVRLLPVAAIYGANASGKSGLVQALRFLKDFVLTPPGTPYDPILRIPYRLDDKGRGNPTKFEITVLAQDDEVYQYGISLTDRSIKEEFLVRLRPTKEELLFLRQDNRIVEVGKSLSIERQHLDVLQAMLRENVPFLSHLVFANSGKIAWLVFSWFKDTLEIILPDSVFLPMDEALDPDGPLFSEINHVLPLLDTGIERIDTEKVPLAEITMPGYQSVEEGLRHLGIVGKVQFTDPRTGDRLLLERNTDGEIEARRIVFYHRGADGKTYPFRFGDESDGTRRLLDILPAIVRMSRRNDRKVFVFDELDRSMHTLLTRNLLEIFLSDSGPESRMQLIMTTHDVMLLDQKLLRKDEMWALEKNAQGRSELFSFAEFDLRHDHDIRKYYLAGKLGGVPRLNRIRRVHRGA